MTRRVPGGDPLTMSIRPIGTRRQMETQKFATRIGSSSDMHTRTHNTRAREQRGVPCGTQATPPSVSVIFTRQTISRGIESSGFIIRDRRNITGERTMHEVAEPRRLRGCPYPVPFGWQVGNRREPVSPTTPLIPATRRE